MPSSLGIYIEENVIKYAKVSKDRDSFKIESFGIKFYENIEETIDQIVAETSSQKTPISINLSDEMYNYFFLFNMLSKNDYARAIETEFDSFCYDNGLNDQAYETRYIVTNSVEDKEKLKIIHIAGNKTDINKRNQQLQSYHFTNISPLPMAVSNLLTAKGTGNSAIINIEDLTTITTIIEGNIYDVTRLDAGAGEILRKIKAKENSYLKAYEICKNTTIYTSTSKEVMEDENEYLEDIMPTLYDIVANVQKVLSETPNKIENIYLTGTAAVINNLDLYFGEYLPDIKCELLKPYFLTSTANNINIKELIEVNSATALALQGLAVGIKNMNFKKAGISDGLNGLLKLELGGSKKNKPEKQNRQGLNFSFDLRGEFDKIEKYLVRFTAGFVILLIVFIAFSTMLTNQMNKKIEEAQKSIDDTNTQISLMNSDTSKLNSKSTQYQQLIEKINLANEELNAKYEVKDAIPNLLNQIMYVIPKTVQITQIENTVGKHIVIYAQAEKYEDLGYFKAKLKLDNVLNDVESNSGVKDGNIVKITIEGELP